MYALSKHKRNMQTGKNGYYKVHKAVILSKIFFGIKLLHANVQCVYNMQSKYQMASLKALVQIDFPVHALSEH